VDSIAQFNGTITRCPIVVDDECAALRGRKVTSAEFRQRVQATERDYEPKGQEKIQLIGCTREGITANDLAEVTFAAVNGSGVSEALRDRLLVVECLDANAARAALTSVRAGSDDREIERIMGHLAWVWATHELQSAGRFIGAGGDNAARVAIAGIAADGAEMWDYLASWLDVMQKDNAMDAKVPAAPWVWRGGEVWANASAIAPMLKLKGGHPWSVKEVLRLLRAIASGPAERLEREDGSRARYWPLDSTQLSLLLG
jgi:hypothetical protein